MAQQAIAMGWIGVGKMGLPMIRRLIVDGRRVAAFDLNKAAVDRAVAVGAERAESAAAVCAFGDIIVSMVPDDAALLSLAGTDGPVPALRPGQVFVDMSTVSPEASARFAKLIPAGVDYVRAPVSGSTATAEAGMLVVLASGPETAVRRFEGSALSFAKRLQYVGEAEQARYLKLALNILVGATASIVAESLALVRSAGISPAALYEAIAESAVSSPLLAYKRGAIIDEDFSPAFTVAQMLKDFRLIEGAAAGCGVSHRMPISALVLRQLAESAERGDGARDFFALIRGARESRSPLITTGA